jgi:hypothetical protein
LEIIMDEYEVAKAKLDKYVAEAPLQLQLLDNKVLEERVASDQRIHNKFHTVEHRCVNYLRHRASAYDEIINTLNSPGDLFSTTMERHVLHVERRSCVAKIKQRILDEIATAYPGLRDECRRLKLRDGLEDDPSEFVLPFGPFKGMALRNLDTDYLLRLLGQGFVRKSLRSRIERHLAEREVSSLPLPQ